MLIRMGKRIKGSLTLEAAFVIPVFIIAIMAFIMLIHIVYVQMSIQSALNYTAYELQSKGVVYEYLDKISKDKMSEVKGKIQEFLVSKNELFNNDYFEEALSWSLDKIKETGDEAIFEIMLAEKVNSYLEKENIDYSCVSGDYKGIDFGGSTVNVNTGEFNIVASYEVKCPIILSSVIKFKVNQNVKGRTFGGNLKILGNEDRNNENDETMESKVYVTQSGKVYHTQRDCIYLTNRMLRTDYGEIASKRNNSGGKYYPCEKCKEKALGEGNDYVYYSKEGERYHLTLQCSAIARQIEETTLDKIGEKRMCEKCGER